MGSIVRRLRQLLGADEQADPQSWVLLTTVQPFRTAAIRARLDRRGIASKQGEPVHDEATWTQMTKVFVQQGDLEQATTTLGELGS